MQMFGRVRENSLQACFPCMVQELARKINFLYISSHIACGDKVSCGGEMLWVERWNLCS